MKNWLLAGAASVFAAFGSANAALLDFVAEAAGNERGVADGTTIAFDDINVTFSSLSAGQFFAYFDDLSGGKPGGLGVCTTLTGPAPSPCADPADDNIRAGQAVTLTFDQRVTLADFSFNPANHDSLNGNDVNTLLIAINDANAFVRYTFAEAVASTFAGVELIRFSFDNAEGGRQFYVSSLEASAVPLPAAAPLLIAGAAGLGLASRRRRQKV